MGGASFWAYNLQSAEGRFYVGSTDDLRRRVAEHNSALGDGQKFTHKSGFWTLVRSEGHPTRAAAMARERQIKSMKSAKWIRDLLLNGRVPTGRD